MKGSHDAQERITGFWSTVAPDYEAHGGNVPKRRSREYAAWVDALRDLLPSAPADVLDIATGTGFVALIAAALGHRVTGIDLAEQMLVEARHEAKRRRIDVTFALLDAVAPSLPEAGFDAIISRHFIWTLREPSTALANWRKLLRAGGRVIAIDGFWFDSTDPEPDDPAEIGLFDQHYTKETRAALPTMRFTSTQPVAELFEAAGFTDVTVSDLADVHRLAKDPPGAAPWYVVVGRA